MIVASLSSVSKGRRISSSRSLPRADPGLDVREKLPRYREARIEEIWLVDPFEQRVRCERKTTEGYTSVILTAGRLASSVVPGFWIEVEWLWLDELPAPLACLRQMLQ